MNGIKLPIRIGIIGTGFGQAVHIPAFKADPRCTITAVCSRAIEEAKKVAIANGIEKYFDDWKQLVHSKEVDAISIALPPHLQEEIALEAFKLGKAVFCEKPLATSISAAKSIHDAAIKTNLPSSIDFEFTEIPQWKYAKEYIESEHLGTIHYVCINWHVETYANHHQLSSWKSDFDQGGGALNLFVSHCFYYIEWLLGPINSLCALLTKSAIDSRNGDTICLIQCVLESGSHISLSVCSSAYLVTCHRLEFYGNEGTLILENSSSDYINGFKLFFGNRQTQTLNAIVHEDDWLENDGNGRVRAVSQLTSRFIDSIITGSPMTPDLEDGLRVQQLIEAAKESMKNRQWIKCSKEKVKVCTH